MDGSNIIAGGDFSSHIAAYINEEWTDLGAGLDGTVRALAVWDDEIYAGGKFATSGETIVNNIAVFSSSNWQALGAGLNGKVTSLAAGQNGIYAGGGFRHSGEVELNHIGCWDGSQWLPLGNGLNDEVIALAVYNDETHHKELVYAAGNFQFAGAVSVSRIGVYDGTDWQALGSGLNGPATALAIDENSGNLFVSGNFTQAGGVPVAGFARWDSEEWFTVGDGLDSTVSNLHFINDDLYAVTLDGVYRLDSDSWTEIYSYVDARINCLAGLDDDIVMGGTFSRIAGVDALRVAVWDGINWHALGGGFDGNISSVVSALLWHEGILYACGNFEIQDGKGGVAHAAYWDGVDWYPIGSGAVGEHYNQMVWYGDKLYIRTTASEVFTWDGESFEQFKGGYNSVMENSEGLIFGLNSYRQPADIEARNIALWDGSEYHALGDGVNGRVHTIEEHNGEIYIGGSFTRTFHNNPVWLKYVAKWNTANEKWEPVAGGLPGTVLKLRSLDARLFACTEGHGVYELVGNEWVRYDKYCRGTIRDSVLFAGELIVGGEFSSIVGLGPATLVRWDGTDWEIVAQGQYQYSAIEDLCTDNQRIIAAGSQWHCPEFNQEYGQVRVGEFYPT